MRKPRSPIYSIAKTRLWTFVRMNSDYHAGNKPKLLMVCELALRIAKLPEMPQKQGEHRREYIIRIANACGVLGIPWQLVGKPYDRPPSEDAIQTFYRSSEWLCSRGRYMALKRAQGCCQLCGARAGQDGMRLVVDHIEPIRAAWSRRFDPDNLQVLCDGCNRGKGSWDCSDWRSESSASRAETGPLAVGSGAMDGL